MKDPKPNTEDVQVSRKALDSLKKREEYRIYVEDTNVSKFYYNNHVNQTYEAVQAKKKKFLENMKLKFTIMDCVKRLNEVIDDSDPDNIRPQIVHAIQTGEHAKKNYPDLKWMHLTGFIHDLGKIMIHKDLFGEPQWCTVGDTYPVGCAFHEKNVFSKYFEENPDSKNPKYNTKYGVYEPNCGFDNVEFSWSHDEYMYQVLKKNKCLIPEEGMYMIRYHSFYPWHSFQAYDHLANEKDKEMLKYLKMFQECDLYSKIDEDIKIEPLLPYYEGLIKEFIPNDNELFW